MELYPSNEAWLEVIAFQRAVYRHAVRRLWRRLWRRRPSKAGGRYQNKARFVNPAPAGRA